MTNEGKYWKCEYENLRRKNKKKIERMELQQAKFVKVTFNLLTSLGLPIKWIIDYYERELGYDIR